MRQTSQKNKLVEMYWLLVVDLIMIMLSYLLAVILRFGSIENTMKNLHVSTCLCFMLVSVVYSLVLDWNSGFINRGYLVEFIAIFKYNIVLIFAVACFLFVTSMAADFSRLIWGYVFVLNMIFTFTAHIVIKKILKRYYKSEHCRVKVMVITDSENYDGIAERLCHSIPINYDITLIAFLGKNKEKKKYDKIPVIVEADNIIEKVRQMPMDEVFIHISEMKTEKIKELINDFESMGIICHYNIDIIGWNTKESSIGKFGDYAVVTYSIYQTNYARRIIKRMIDIIGGGIGLIITGLLFPFVAILIKGTSNGPILFSQIRIGKNGRRFKIYKFRSMYADAELRKKELEKENELSGPIFKMKNDPRITPVGKWLRKTSIDEFPQFYNVLRGDMSLVGTRPPTVDEFEHYSLYYRRRLSVTPGLTGLWQVSGRSNIEDFDEIVKIDLDYIDNWSLTLDMKILLKTIWVVFTGKGAK